MIKKVLMLCVVLFSLCTATVMADIVYPPSVHPYIYVNDEYINAVSSIKDTDKDYEKLKNVAESELPVADGVLDAEISRQLEIRAFMYVLGEVDKNHAVQTAEYAINYLSSPKTKFTYSIDVYKDFGENGIQTGALIYDWCYSALDEETRKELAQCVYNIIYLKDDQGKYIQPCRPNNMGDWSDVAGKAVGQPLVYNAIAATALYDVYPEIYNAVMPKIQGSMADIVKYYGQAGALSDRSISYNREFYAYYVSVLFERMGYENFYGDQRKVGYKILYSRLPYGAYIKQGDDPKQRDYKIGRFVNGSEIYETTGLLSAMYKDPYLKFQYAKENEGNTYLFSFLLKKSDVKPSLPDDLPLSFYVKSPGSEILARTSWIDGISSPAVVCYLNMNNRRSGDHDHADMGNFQLYYKGPLTMPSGIYTSAYWGEKHWSGYYSRTVSSNCVTVCNPSESFQFGAYNINDGGQKIVTAPLYKYSAHMADENIRARELAHYIGPNEITPAFSYIKGDLKNAYTDKVTDYKRSMVFMDLFSDKYPGALIVLDKVSSSDASFKKKWLLQAVAKPEVADNTITITNTDDGGGGKLVNNTLLPESVSVDTVGGIDEFVVNTNGKTEYFPADEVCMASSSYKSGYRCEVSPLSSQKDDLFLNVMYVTDDENTEKLSAVKKEFGSFIGASLLDRLVLFSKSGEIIKSEFNISVDDNQTICFISDVEKGKWKIKAQQGGSEIVVLSRENENVLCFRVDKGNYVITPADSNASETVQLFEQVSKEKTGDFVVKCDAGYINPVNETKVVNNIPYTSAEILEEMGCTLRKDASGYYAEKNGKTLYIPDSGKSFVFCGAEIPLANSCFYDGDIFYIPICEFSPFLGYKMTYNSEVLKLSCDSFSKIINVSGDMIPDKIAPAGSALLIDGYISEDILVSDEEAIVLSFDDVKKITSLKMYCEKNYDKIKILASADGKTFYSVKNNITTADNLRMFSLNCVAKVIKIYAEESVLVREIRIFADEFENKCSIINTLGGENHHSEIFISDYIKNYSAREKLAISFYADKDLKNISIFADDIKIFEDLLTGAEFYGVFCDISKIKPGYHKIRLVCSRDGAEYQDEREIYVSDASEYETIFEEKFSDDKTYNFYPNNNSEITLNDGKAKITLLRRVENSEPFLLLRNFGVVKGKTRLSFDAKFSSYDSKLLLELRDGKNQLPQSGAYYTVYSVGKIFGTDIKNDVTYKITVEFDSVNALLNVYVDGKFAGSQRIRTDGISQLRICFRGGYEGINFEIDNINISHSEFSDYGIFADVTATRKDREVTFMVNSDVHKGGKVKYIKVIKKNDAVLDVEIESFPQSGEGESVQTIYLEDDSHTAELYIASYYDIFTIYCKKAN